MAGPAPTGMVNFWANPVASMYPVQLVEQQKIDRQRALAAALQQQALEPIDAGRGQVSWTQGAAKMVQALSAALMNRKEDKAQAAVYATMANPVRQRLGLPPVGTSAPDANGIVSAIPATPSNIPDQSATPSSFSAAPDMGNLGPVPQGASTVAQAFPDMTGGNAPPAPPPASVAPPAPAQAPPMAPTGTGSPDFAGLLADPQYQAIAYPEQVVQHDLQASLPTDIQKLVTARRTAALAGDWDTARTLDAQITKLNLVPPINVREGGAAYDPVTHQPVFTNPHTPIGAVTNWGPDGRPTGMTMVPGATNAIAAAEGSKTAAQNANEPIAGYDAKGNPIFGSKLDAAHGGNPNFRPSPPLGAAAAADVTGKNSAQEFQAISDRAADVPTRIMALRQMQTLVSDPKTVLGPGSHSAAQVNGVFGTISQSMGIPFNPQVATNAAEFNKWASQYSARTAQELGLSGSDSRLALAVHASPNGQMTPQALRQMLPQFIGMENAKQGMATAANAWQQAHGAGTVQQFRSAWNANFDPRIYQWMAQGPQAFAANVKGLSPQEAAAVRHKYLVLKQMGALPQ